MNKYAGCKDEGSTTADHLLAGEFPRVTKLVTITGGDYKRGAVLGKISADDKYTIAKSDAQDGSKTPEAILAEDVDATDDAQAIVYLTGEFNSSALTVGTGLTVDAIQDDLRAKSIFVKTNQS